jgi:DNA repair protein RadD
MNFIPRWYQDDAVQSIYDYFLNGGKGNPLIALPTASGKSCIPALFIERAMRRWPNQRFLLLTHVKELIKQNSEKMFEVWANAPLGIYSAGLKRRDVISPIVYGGIQSMIRIAEAFGWRDIIFVDECHLISQDEDSAYLRFFAIMKAINPNIRIIGLTATKYRMGQGLLTNDGVFNEIIYDMTTLEGYNKLLYEGYLSPLVAPSRLSVSLDVSNVGSQRGEFLQGQLQHEVDKTEITWKLLQEAVYFGQNRCSWLIFASGIDHSDHIAEMLNRLGVDCASVHSRQTDDYNDSALKAHKALKLRAIVSYSKLTTGLDHPAVDLIIDGRPTLSVPLHVQKYGRGGRISPLTGKQNCLVLDYARNTARLGPVNDPVIPRKKGDKQGEIPIKICETCGVYNHISARECSSCNHPFEFKVKIVEQASSEDIIREFESPIIEYHDVSHVIYKEKQKAGKAPYLTITYFSGMDAFKEFVFPENTKFKRPFTDWWRQRSPGDVPTTTAEAVLRTGELRQPKRIRVHVNRKLNGKTFPEVLSSEW